MNPCQLFKSLADDYRLTSLLLISQLHELCVCDLMVAMDVEQSKISRHLAALRKNNILLDERRGKWVFYKLHPELPSWVKQIIIDTSKHNSDYFALALKRLKSSKTGNIPCC
jgi:ArsR family transcriptional regulator, arsenate/arsenite/antimonite-responsive transcriptional repressor